ncbi:hypothetical protein BDZ97DRAFT_2060947 [Flammula alnicola]|nr:hypothetical protein BDZ97DRAFT_2060947 [Flammula alnicola]
MNIDGISNSAGLVRQCMATLPHDQVVIKLTLKLLLDQTFVKVQYKKSPGLGRRLGLFKTSGRAKAGSRPIPLARLGPASLGPAWLGFWPQAGAGTSLLTRPCGSL